MQSTLLSLCSTGEVSSTSPVLGPPYFSLHPLRLSCAASVFGGMKPRLHPLPAPTHPLLAHQCRSGSNGPLGAVLPSHPGNVTHTEVSQKSVRRTPFVPLHLCMSVHACSQMSSLSPVIFLLTTDTKSILCFILTSIL